MGGSKEQNTKASFGILKKSKVWIIQQFFFDIMKKLFYVGFRAPFFCWDLGVGPPW